MERALDFTEPRRDGVVLKPQLIRRSSVPLSDGLGSCRLGVILNLLNERLGATEDVQCAAGFGGQLC